MVDYSFKNGYPPKKGEIMLNHVRATIQKYAKKGEIHKISSSECWLDEDRALFVTLKTHPEKELRGCTGFTEPKKLRRGLIEASLAAAFEDPRFAPINEDELNRIVAELSILTPPIPIKQSDPEKILEEIEPNKDGLILKRGDNSGLFLPQVWSQIKEPRYFLAALCQKAGLFDPHAWKDPATELHKFRVQVFEEEEPNGKIVMKKL